MRISDSDDDDVPMVQTKRARIDSDQPSHSSKMNSDSDDFEAPKKKEKVKTLVKTVKTKTPSKPKATPKEPKEKTPKVKSEPVKKSSDKLSDSPKKTGDEEQEEEEYKWWLDQNKDDSVKWASLEHAGPYFPPEYEPHGVRMRYDGIEIPLLPASEEIASFFAAVIGTDWGENATFQRNFFSDFRAHLKEFEPHCPIREFAKCDFTPITEYLNVLKEKKKTLTKAEKQVIKEEKAELDKHYAFCLLDGRKEKVGNYRIEPPGLFRGRGEHPKTGALKTRVTPEQVTLNLSDDAVVPTPPAGHSWGSIIHDNKVSWLAMWRENVNDSFKYIFLSANSSLKGQSDFKKFEKARELKTQVARIRTDYAQELKHEEMFVRQRATALYFIDRLALRAGNEKGEDEADTVGCCSLRVEHITLAPPNKVIFDFLGKDSIRYYNEVEVDPQVFKNIKIFKKEPKKEGDDLFDRLNTSLLNKYLTTYMAGLTAKVFRTYNASYTFQEELKKTPKEGTVAEKILAYNRANRQVAILCNHQRSIPKAHGTQMARMKDKVLAVKYERSQVKEQMIALDPKLKKTRPELVEPESDLDDDFITRHELALIEKEKEAALKKFEKDNEKRKEETLPPLSSPEPPKKRALISSLTLDKLEKKYETLTNRLGAQKNSLIDRDENKTTSLGTSKINYIDPRISASWCKLHDVPLEKIFNRSLRDKFKWAMEVDGSWTF